MKKFKLAILSIIISIIIIIAIIIVLINKDINDNLESDFVETEFEQIDTYEPQEKIIQVDNRNKYYAIEKILNTYLYYIKEMKGIIDFQKYDDIEVKKDGVSRLYNILDFEYISEFNVKKEELQDKIKEYSNYKLEIQKMYVYEKSSSINIYFVYFSIDNENIDLLVKTDSENMTFSIFLDDYMKEKSYGIDMNVKEINISDSEIEKNNDNQYKYINITDEYMVVQYVNSLINNLNKDTKYVYNNLMQKEYREKRFRTSDIFLKYVEDNKEVLQNIKPVKYMVNYYEDYREYICIDQYQNYYIFRENAIMDYTFKLDTYTITTDKFKEEYKNADIEEKVQLNIDKFIKMINAHDYINAYDYLPDSFKNNYFNTKEEFENYAKSFFFIYNKVKYNDLSEQGNNIYMCNLQLSDLTQETNEIKDFNIIIQLKDDMDFVLSFEVE